MPLGKSRIEADLLTLESFLSRKPATMIAPDDETQVEYWSSSTWQGDDDDVEIWID